MPILYRLHLKDNITLGEGRGNTFIMLLRERRRGDCGNAIKLQMFRDLRWSYAGRPSASESFWKKMIGKPCAGPAITNPAVESEQLEYTNEGLPTSYIDPRNKVHNALMTAFQN